MAVTFTIEKTLGKIFAIPFDFDLIIVIPVALNKI